MKTGRNEPCPCGSGKKYKHCCLAGETATTAEPDVIAAQRKAHEWLQARFGRTKRDEVIREYFDFVDQFALAGDDDESIDEEDGYDDEPIDHFLRGLDDGEHYTLATGLNDWALHETAYERHGEAARGIDWVLRARDAHLSATQHAFLQAAAASHLHVYEVTGVEDERGLHLRDVLEPEEPTRFVHEVSATRGLRRGDFIGTRVIEYEGRLELGGALYQLSTIGVLELLSNLDDPFDAEPHGSTGVPAEAIRNLWLLDRLQPPLLRGRPQTLRARVEDVYDVLDVESLHRALLVSGEARPLDERQAQWFRETDDIADFALLTHPLMLDEAPESRWRRFAHAHADDDRDCADRTRAWLEAVAGAHLRHRERQYHPESRRDDFRLPLPADLHDANSAPRTRDISAYANWCDETLDVLSGTPRQAQGDALGRYRTHLLLNCYDDVERMLAPAEKREPVSFDFLREALGLPLARDAT